MPLEVSATRLKQMLAFGLLAAHGCTLLSDFDVTVCSTDADCDLLGASVARCEDSRCVEGCADNRHCSSVDPRYPICPFVGSRCVDLATADGECSVSSGYVDETMGSSTGQDLLLVGAFVPDGESSSWLTLQLGAAEINEQGGMVSGAGERQPLLVIGCDDRIGSIPQTMRHLVEELGVRAILSSLEGDALDAAASLAATRGSSLLLAPDGAALGGAARDDPSVWSLGAPTGPAVQLYPELMLEAERSVAAGGVDLNLAKIASIVSTAREDVALEEAVAPLVRIGGKDVQQLVREDRYRRIELPDASVADRDGVLAALVDYAPDILLAFVGGSFPAPAASPRSGFLRDVENAAVASVAWRPMYVLGPRSAHDPVLRALAKASAAFRARAAGLTSDRELDAPLMASAASRFDAAFPESTAEALAVVPGMYDALYYLTYAQAAATPRDGAQLTAGDLVYGLSKVTSSGSVRVDVGPGPDGLSKAQEALASGVPFDTFGLSGAAAFDSDRARSSAARFYCFDEAGQILYAAPSLPPEAGQAPATVSPQGYACAGGGP